MNGRRDEGEEEYEECEEVEEGGRGRGRAGGAGGVATHRPTCVRSRYHDANVPVWQMAAPAGLSSSVLRSRCLTASDSCTFCQCDCWSGINACGVMRKRIEDETNKREDQGRMHDSEATRPLKHTSACLFNNSSFCFLIVAGGSAG